MGDPIKDLYEFSIKNRVLDTSLSEDNFRDMFINDPASRVDIFTSLKRNNLFDESSVFSDFEKDFLPVKADLTKLKSKTSPIISQTNTDLEQAELAANAAGVTLSDEDKAKFSLKKDKELDNAIIEEGITKYTPAQISEIKYGTRDNNKITSAKNTTEKQKRKASFIENLKNFKLSTLLSGNREKIIQGLSTSDELSDMYSRPDVIELDVKLQQYAEYNNLLDKSLDKAKEKYPDSKALDTFIKLDRRLQSGEELAPEEEEFYSKQLENIKDTDILSILDKRDEIRKEMSQLPIQHKQAFLKKSLEDSSRKEFDKNMQNGYKRALYTIGQVIDAVPGALSSELAETALTFQKDVGSLSLLSGGNQDYWQKTSKQSRPGNENIAYVNFKGSKYEAAFDEEGRLYNVYDSKGNVADLSDSDYSDFVKELNRQNPNHETKRVKNLESQTVNALQSLTDIMGTFVLGYGAGSTVLRGVSALGKVGAAVADVAGSARVLEFVPVLAQYTGTYAKQAIREGGVIDPDKVMGYGIAGAATEAAIEMLNPMVGKLAQRASGLNRKVTKELIEDAIGKNKGFVKSFLNTTKEVAKNVGSEIGEEELANITTFGLNETYNKFFDAHFDNENPLTLETIIDTAYSTAVASILPALIGAGGSTRNSDHVREILFRSLRNPQQAEAVFNKYKETASEEDVKLFNEFKKHYDNTLNSSKEFISGEYSNVSDALKKEVMHKNFEISRLQNKTDDKSKQEVESLKSDIREIALLAKYDIDTDFTFSSKDIEKKNEVLDKIDEIFANKDLSKMKPGTRGKLYKKELSNILENPELDVKDLDKDVQQDKIDFFNKAVTNKISDLRQKYTLDEIENNLLKSEDLFDAKYELPKAARELYIKKAIKEEKAIEENARLEKEREELINRTEKRQFIQSRLSEGDVLRDKLTGFEYTYRGYKDEPIILNEDGNPLINTYGEKVTVDALIDTLDTNYEIIKYVPETPIEDVTEVRTSTNQGTINITSKGVTIKDGVAIVTDPTLTVDGDLDVMFENFINPNQTKESFNRIAFLGLDYDEAVDQGYIDRNTTSSIVFDKAIQFLNPKNYESGTKLVAKINDSDKTLVYDPSYDGRKEITWGELKQRLSKGVVKTPTGMVLTYEDLVPIDLYKNGKKIPANVHTKAWVEKNALPKTKESELLKISALRKSIKGDTELIISSYSNGPMNIGEYSVVPDDVTLVEIDGKVHAKTTTGNTRVNMDFIGDREVNSIVSAIQLSLGLKQDKRILSKLSDDILSKSGLENYISKFIQVEKPKNSSFTQVVGEKAASSKTPTVSIEINTDENSALGFSILLGKTYPKDKSYTITKLIKIGDDLKVQQLKGGKFVTINTPVETYISSYLAGSIAEKRANYKKVDSIDVIENDTVTTENYNDFIRPKVKSNLVFTKVGNSHSIYYQPQITIEPIVLESEIKPTVKSVDTEDRIENDLGESKEEGFLLYPFEEEPIGDYLKEYTIEGISEKLFTDMSRGIAGAAFKAFLGKRITAKELLTEEIDLWSGFHKAILEKYAPKSAKVEKARVDLVNNWSKIEKNAKRIIVDSLKGEVESIEDIDDYIAEYHDEGKAYTKDVYLDSSAELKAFFSFIPDRTQATRSLFALGEKSDLFNYYHTTNDVVTKIFNLVAVSNTKYIEPRWDEMRDRIANSNLTFKNEFLERVELLDDSKRNELVSVMYNSFRSMSLLRIENASGKLSSITTENNFSQTVDKWRNSFLSSGFVVVYDDDNEERIEFTDKFKESTAKLYNLLNKENENNVTDGPRSTENRLKELKSVFDELGIVLDNRTYDLLKSGKNLSSNTSEESDSIFGKATGNLVYTIYENLTKQNIKSVNELFGDSMFGKLALLDIESTINRNSGVVRSGDKQVQSIGLLRNYEARLSRFMNSSKLDYLKDTLFGKNLWWNKAKHIMSYESIPPSAMRNDSTKNESEVSQFGYKDHVLYRAHRLYGTSSSKGYTRGTFVTAPMEDKKNPLAIVAPRVDIVKGGRLNSKSPVRGDIIDLLIHQLVVPELLRIKYEVETSIKGYQPKAFYLVPELNNIAQELLDNFRGDVANQKIEQEGNDISEWFETTMYDKLRGIMENHLNKAVAIEKAEWIKEGIIPKDDSKEAKKKFFNKLPYQIVSWNNQEEDLGIKNYVANYMIFHANEHLLTGDPALYAKDGAQSFSIKDVINTLKNKQKRLALANAPYKHIPEPKDIRLAAIKDPKFKSMSSEFLEAYVDDVSKYLAKEGSDAQLFATADNYLDTLFRFGQITKEQFDDYTAKVKAQREDIRRDGQVREINKIPFSLKGTTFNVLKTVLGDYQNEGARERVVYVKMAEFPLIPQLTQGFEIDKLRQHLEDMNVDKAVFSSGFKVGSPKAGFINNSDKDYVNETSTIESINITEENIIKVNELFYGEQSENPQDYSYEVPHGGQRSKSEFLNILDQEFEDPRDSTKRISGRDLQKLRDSYHQELFDLKLKKLRQEVLLPNGSIDYDKLSKKLEDEIREFDPTYKYSLSKEVIENKIPLWINPLFKRIQPKLLSIVESSVLKLKVRGKSHVQVFSDFFKSKEDALTNIIPTSEFTGELKTIRDKDGNVLSAQILVPWNFKAKRGDAEQDISITDFMRGGAIDPNKISKELLQSIGFRIPTSGHNSVARLEIVGFLPSWVGNTILMPSDLMVQMGSDLDFDKLYNLFYNWEVTKDLSGNKFLKDPRKISEALGVIGYSPKEGDYNLLFDRSDSRIKELENNLLDVSRVVYSSNNPILRNLNHKPIGYGKLETLAKEFPVKEDIYPTSPNFHIKKYLSGRVGKIGVGSFSIDNTFHAALQGTGITYKTYNRDHFPYFEGEELYDKNGNVYKAISLDRVRTNQSKDQKDVKKVRYISDIYSAFQNASLDEGKEQLLQTLGITADTFHFVRGMVQTGHEEDEIIDIVNKPVIRDLMTELSKYTGLFSSYKDQATVIFEAIQKEKNPDNIKALTHYQAYYELGKSLSGIRTIFNMDSKGYGGSSWTSIIKEKKIAKMEDLPFDNLDKLIYKDGQETYLSSSTRVGIQGLEMFYTDNLIPFKNDQVLNTIDSVMELIPDNFKNSVDSESNIRNEIFDEWLKYFYSGFKSLFGVDNVQEERKRLLIADNLATKIDNIKKLDNPRTKNNKFLNILASKRANNIQFLTVPYNQIENISALDLQRSVIDLYKANEPIYDNYTTKDLVEDLYKYAYLVVQEQGPNSYLKYLPLDYIYENPDLKKVSIENMYRASVTKLSGEYNSFVIQFFQHNPKLLTKVGSDTLYEFDNGAFGLVPGSSAPDIVNYETREKDLILVKSGNAYIPIDKVGNYLHSSYDIDATKTLTSLRPKKDNPIPTEVPSESTERKVDLKEILSEQNLSKLNKLGPVFKYLSKIAEVAPNVTIIVDSALPSRGRFDRKSNTIRINSKLNTLDFYKTLAHELVHAIDYNIVKPEVKKIREELEAIYTEIYNAQSEEFQTKVQELNKRKVLEGKEFKVTKEELDNFYYQMSNSNEFLAFFTDEDTGFRDWINGIDVKRNNWYQKLRDLINKLIQSITGSKELTDVIDSYIFDIVESKASASNNSQNAVTQSTQNKTDVDKIIDSKTNLDAPAFELYPQIISVDDSGKVNYKYQAELKIFSKEGQNVINKGVKNNWSLDKILSELQVPNDEKDILLQQEGNTVEEKLANLLANYSYTVEINTAKEKPVKQLNLDSPESFIDDFGNEYTRDYSDTQEGFDYFKNGNLITKQQFDKEYQNSLEEVTENKNTEYYSNLTVPGGTNGSYIEANIETPMIVPSIQSHAQFKTDNTIGWMRADEKQNYQEKDIDNLIEIMKKSGILEVNCG